MRGFLRVLSTALLLLTVALVSALITMRLAVHGREVDVPDLRGKTPSEARRLAEELGLSAQIDRQYYSAIVPEGRVLSQTPAANSVVRRGWNLRLAVSLGPQRVTIPEVVGESQRAAGIILEQRSLDSSVAQIGLPGTTAGRVLAQDPPANAADVAAPKVNLLVAQEPAGQAYVMPSFIGRSLGSVALSVKNAGFTIGKVTIQNGTAVPASSASESPNSANSTASLPSPTPAAAAPSPASIVVSHQPAAGQKIVAGAEISFVVR